MKKFVIILSLLAIATIACAATITTNPAQITQGYKGNITITFNPTGTPMAGASNCYAYTGVTTKEKGAWQCAPAWTETSKMLEMTKSGSNWVCTINNMYNLFSCASKQTFTAINIIFRTKDGKSQTSDLSIPVYEEGFIERDPTPKARPSGVVEGIYYNQSDASKVTLCIYAANKSGTAAKNVYILGDFNGWGYSNNYQCYKDGNFFWIEITGLTSGKEYCFQYAVRKADGTTVMVADPYSEKVLYPDDKYEPKTLDPSLPSYPGAADGGYVTILQPGKAKYNWSSATLNFQKPNRNNLVIYELWVKNFAKEGSYKSVKQRIAYFKNLGVNAIELMPVSEFDGNISWGYNPTMYFAPDKAYGKESDLKDLIDECHKNGIAVIMDMVINHATDINSQRKMYPTITENPWFNASAPHGSNVFSDWNHEFAQTKSYFERVLKFWITEYKVDGYRMDLSHGICGPNCNNRVSLINNYYNAVKSANANAYFILEHWEGMGERGGYVNNGMMCWENTNNAYMQTAMGWLKDGDSFSNACNDGYVSYCESHDEQRCFWKAKKYGNGNLKTSEADRIARVPLNVAFNAMLNGPQMFYMFAELGYDWSFCANSSGAGDTKDKGETPCYETDTKPIPEVKGWYKLSTTRMAAYQKLGQIIQLRTRILPAVFTGNPTSTDVNSGNSLRSVIWGTGNDRVFIIGNFNVSGGTQYTGAKTYNLPTGNNWYDYLANSSTPLNGGSQQTLQPGEIKVFTASKKTLPEVPNYYDFTKPVGVEEVDASSVDCSIYPTVTSDFIKIDTEETVNNAYVVGLNGSMYKCNLNENLVIDVAGYTSGLYLLIVQFDKEEQAFKFYKE